jgi:hypothetical protein
VGGTTVAVPVDVPIGTTVSVGSVCVWQADTRRRNASIHNGRFIATSGFDRYRFHFTLFPIGKMKNLVTLH